MEQTLIAIVCGASLLLPAAGCSSSSGGASSPRAADAAVDGGTGSSPGSDGSTGVEETDGSSTPVDNVAACMAAGGVCTMTATCVVTGPVNCGPGEICCMAAGGGMDAEATPDVCASSSCSDDAGTVAVADASLEAASRDANAGD
jgi:hypothetical protein